MKHAFIAAHQVMPHQHHQPLRGELPQDGAKAARVYRPGAADRRVVVLPGVFAGMNCTKIGLPGKRILSKRRGLLEVLFSCENRL